MIHKELCKKFEFDRTKKWYTIQSESVLKNKMQKIPKDFEIQRDHLIPARRQDLKINNDKKKKKTCRIVDYSVLTDHRLKIKENEKRVKYLDLAGELRKQRNTRVYSDANCNWRTRNGSQSFEEGTGRVENQRTNCYHTNYSIIQISQNTEMSPGDLRRLALTQTPEKSHLLMLVQKLAKSEIIIIAMITNFKKWKF